MKPHIRLTLNCLHDIANALYPSYYKKNPQFFQLVIKKKRKLKNKFKKYASPKKCKCNSSHQIKKISL